MGEAKRRKKLDANYGKPKPFCFDENSGLEVPSHDFWQASLFIEQQEKHYHKLGRHKEILTIILTNDERGFTESEIEMLSQWCNQRTWRQLTVVGVFQKECPTLEKAITIFSNVDL